MTRMKAIMRHLLGDKAIGMVKNAIGMINYIRFPSRGAAWDGPFNGQTARQALFHDIIIHSRPRAIVETGTYLGTTTDFLADTGLPVYSIEADPRNYGFARARLWLRRNVTLLQGDSRETLHKLINGPLLRAD